MDSQDFYVPLTAGTVFINFFGSSPIAGKPKNLLKAAHAHHFSGVLFMPATGIEPVRVSLPTGF